jgi:hypothetical protein
MYNGRMDSDFAQPRRIPRLHIALELSVILIVLFIFTTPLQDLSADTRIQGVEFSYLINSGAIAHEIFQDTSAIPLWNPFIGRGEPLIENPFSYVLNPLMSIPVIGLGPAQGAKIAVLLHIALMALGGWALADSLRMGAAGRLLLALLLAGNGSFTGAIGEGFYQMSLSQTYAPFIYAGLIGVLYRRDRASIGVFAVFSALMVFAGTYWYVLPTASGVIVISAFALIGAGDRRFRIESVKRLLWAGALTVGLTAIRTLPQAIHDDLVIHPNADLDAVTDFFGVVRNYIETTVQPAPDRILNAIDYHYILSPLFGAFVVIGWIAVERFGITTRGRKRIVIPAIALITLFTCWAQGGIAPMRWLYDAIPLLDEWRLTGRMLAAATPLIALLLALAFDDIVSVCRRQISRGTWRNAALAARDGISAHAPALQRPGVGAGAARGRSLRRIPLATRSPNFAAECARSSARPIRVHPSNRATSPGLRRNASPRNGSAHDLRSAASQGSRKSKGARLRTCDSEKVAISSATRTQRWRYQGMLA